MVEISREMIAAKERAEAVLLKLPGVTGVDIGYKEVGGEKTGTIAIRVLVEKKVANPPAKERIPAEIDGHPTDVIERKFELQDRARKAVSELLPEADTGTYTPLKGGISIGPCRSVGGFVYAGTLGAIVTDNSSGKHMLLSNFHVMCIDSNFHVGDTQCQPSRVDGGSCPTGVVGTLARQSLGGSVDCAVADISGSRGVSCEITEIGFVAGTNTATLGEPVRKRGRTTGLTYGTVDSVNLSASVDYGPGIGVKTLMQQIGVKPDPAHNAKFGDHGDSGSVVVNNNREVIGLHFAGDDTGYGVANPIAAVLTALDVKICVGGLVKIKDHKFEKLEFKEHRLEKILIKEHKLEKIEIKDLGKFEHGEKPIGKEKDGKELKEGGFEGPGGPGGPGDPGPLAGAKVAELKKVEAGEKPPKIEKNEKQEGKDKLEKIEKPESKSELKDYKNEAKDFKDHKNEAKEHKNEAKDFKDHKHEKIEIKDHKLEKIEIKDLGKFEHGEKPIGKEKDGKELKEGGFEGPGGPGGPGDPGPISHFIGTADRPDLAYGALLGEPDLAMQSAALAKEATDAKNRKDVKDTEKLREQ